MASQFSWSSTAIQTPVLPWTPLHHTTIKQEPMDPIPANGFLSNQSEGFHSASPSSSSRDSNSHSPVCTSVTSPGLQVKPNFSFLTPPGMQVSPQSISNTLSVAVTDTPPKSPSPQSPWAANMDVASTSGDSAPEEEVPGLTMPAINSHGKMKKFKCKQCGFVAVTKMSFWDHSKTHIKPERMLTCPQCPFVTEYKHHMEYHVRNHDGSKPFTCPHCPYTCVNKSMLNSHLKSHSSIYQYRCADCTYATKYCHSLKLHLRKYEHRPDVVLNLDGTPNPLPIIDIYGTRRGPKRRTQTKLQEEQAMSAQTPPQMPMYPNQFNFPYAPLHSMLFQHNNNLNETSIVNKMLDAQNNLPTHFLLQQNLLSGFNQDLAQFGQMPQMQSPTSPIRKQQEDTDALDLTNAKHATPIPSPSTPSPSTPKNRRKGKAFKISRTAIPMDEESEEPTKIEVPQSLSSEQVEEIEVTVDLPKYAYDSSDGNETDKDKAEEKEVGDGTFGCEHCGILFKDLVMYTMHMGYHGYHHPFTCNMCGHKCDDRVSFFVHIARTKHS